MIRPYILAGHCSGHSFLLPKQPAIARVFKPGRQTQAFSRADRPAGPVSSGLPSPGEHPLPHGNEKWKGGPKTPSENLPC